MILPRVDDNRPFTTLLIALVAMSWTGLILWGFSPYNRFLSHHAIEDLGGGMSPEYAGLALVFVSAWVLMTFAMMLPTALPLVLLFQRFVVARRDSHLLAGVVIAGYLLVWAVFGAAAHVGDLFIHTAVAQSHWLGERPWLVSAATLVVAGVYQFTPFKSFCLDKCRSPFSFVVEHWHGRTPRLDAFWLGVHHGAFCVGCCWSLMLLMFAVGVGNVAWMLALGAIMAVEKNLPWGRRISAPLGILLLAVGIGLIVAHTTIGVACAHDGVTC